MLRSAPPRLPLLDTVGRDDASLSRSLTVLSREVVAHAAILASAAVTVETGVAGGGGGGGAGAAGRGSGVCAAAAAAAAAA
eukprot:CAMPEP_0171850666 /NCGR_PEP_ID=MMETSP0992-20121227/20473_1 /TAXON_ID=483369 /ORGANISM="non described non described, Strain CCMP2098" /LENGTH=80 /DNA_ID=CAMNT_0012470241 /DNA_START=192 /DNA_END=431 /DNA_ORIENTATION=+